MEATKEEVAIQEASANERPVSSSAEDDASFNEDDSSAEEGKDEDWNLNEAEEELQRQILLPVANKEFDRPARFSKEELRTMGSASLQWCRKTAEASLVEMKKTTKWYLLSIVAFRKRRSSSTPHFEKRIEELEEIIRHYHLISNDFSKEISDIDCILSERDAA